LTFGRLSGEDMRSQRTNRETAAERIAITGVGQISALAESWEETWNNLSHFRSVPTPVPDWLFVTESKRPVFPVRQRNSSLFDLCVKSGILPRDGSYADSSRTFLLLAGAVADALQQSGIDLDTLSRQKVGIVIGTTVGCTLNNEPYYAAWRRGEKAGLDPIRRFIGGNLASALHAVLKTSGPCLVVTNACASGTDAIGIARQWLRTGLCDLAICGGADELSRQAFLGFSSLLLYDDHACRPYDKSRQGLNLGEGAGVMVLEREEDLRDREKSPLGWVRGYATASDAWHPTAPHPDGRGLRSALVNALEDARCQPTDVSLINAHGTGTKANDAVEMKVLADFFQEQKTPFVSTKGLTGHTLGAAGALEAIFTLVALLHRHTPGTTGCRLADPQFVFSPLLHGEKTKLEGKIGISQSLAFGGTNSALILEAV